MSVQTPTLAEAIRAGLRLWAQELRVCLPAEVVTKRGDQLVDVQPLLKVQALAAASSEAMPVLPNVPVSMPRGQTWGIRYPIAVGDTGFVIFADRDLDAWLAGTGSATDATTARTHSLNDAIFVPGLGPDGKQSRDTGSDLVVQAGLATLRVQPGGTFALSNGQQELLSVVTQLAGDVAALAGIVSGLAVVGQATLTPNGAAAANIMNRTGALASLKGN